MMTYAIFIVIAISVLFITILSVMLRIKYVITHNYIKIDAVISDVKRFKYTTIRHNEHLTHTGWQCNVTYKIDSKEFTTQKRFGCTSDVKSPYVEGETLILYVHPKNPEKTVHMLTINIAIAIITLFTIISIMSTVILIILH